PAIEGTEGRAALALHVRVAPPTVERAVAAPEVGIRAGGALRVPSLDGLGQAGSVDAQSLGQLGGRIAATHPVRHSLGLDARGDAEPVSIGIVLIEHEPAR